MWQDAKAVKHGDIPHWMAAGILPSSDRVLVFQQGLKIQEV